MVTIPFGGNDGQILYDLQKGSYLVTWRNDTIIYDAYAAYAGKDSLFSTGNFIRHYSSVVPADRPGVNSLHTIEWEANGLRFQQVFNTSRFKPFFFTQLKVSGKGVASAYISPLTSRKVTAPGIQVVPYALAVPFDNDMWVRYDVQSLRAANFTSSEVTAVFDKMTGTGCILGSLEHTLWKTGIQVSAENGIKVYGGFVDSVTTHDKIPHGKVSVNDTLCASPQIFVGMYTNWRIGMEEYAVENKLMEPSAIEPRKKATPMGWNSWGMMQTKLTLEKAKQVVDYFHDSLKGFRNENNTLYIDLDSYWDNLVKGGLNGDVSQLKEFAVYCKSKGMIPGIYWAPFADWGKYDRPFENSNHRYGDAWIKQKGKPVDLDGALALDPTHPGTQARMALHINKFKELGFEMIKIDFLGHAALESDRFYDPKVTTGMQAYKVGMEYLSKLIDNKMLTYAAISPTMATGRYVNMRRIACDAFSAIDNTEYTMNSTGYGWWQQKLYDYIDADHVVFNKERPGVNRARLASALVTGTLITGDDFSVAGEWGEAAKTLLQNKDLLQVIKQGRPFWPQEVADGKKAPEVFVKLSMEGDRYYMAVFNYDQQAKTYPAETLFGTKAEHAKLFIFTELFSGKQLDLQTQSSIVVPGSDVMLFKVTMLK
ncbi:hypothetical protein [Paraflavitalea sp. CAU 1676]|uniref:hypothetical protein n=1 Tax=Paraflavitalea sp. CAU 1676 TaxID=3032598 RepID=UPI0023DBAF94|nr:hypothetical protein [Paraflavitalea sp. CAU 1676]MDF2188272.1 hypothetical protein [Paraflavitalea sp. CAU 1676]